jgi:hypothetical protein
VFKLSKNGGMYRGSLSAQSAEEKGAANTPDVGYLIDAFTATWWEMSGVSCNHANKRSGLATRPS